MAARHRCPCRRRGGRYRGRPFKDTSGPSLNILIKLMTVVSLVFAPCSDYLADKF